MTKQLEAEILQKLKTEMKGLVTYQEVAEAMKISVSRVSNVLNGYSKYDQSIVNVCLELKDKAYSTKSKTLSFTAKRLKITR